MELITGENDNGRRLDRILRKALPELPLALIHRLLRKGQVLIDEKPVKAQNRLETGVIISIPCLKDTLQPADTSSNLKKNISKTVLPKQKTVLQSVIQADKTFSLKHLPPAEIIWEGIGLIAVNKPVGLAVHGPESLDSAVQSYLEGKLPSSLSFKPGPLHRLDKPSSGIVVFSSSLDGARLFTSLMRERKIRKTYLAIVEGAVEKEEIWEDELFRDREKKKTFVKKEQSPVLYEKESKMPVLSAVTKVTPLVSKNGYSLIQAEIATGRTHQIRAQAAAHGYPLMGDVKYNELRKKNKGHHVEFFLHALRVEFLDYLIEVPPPEAFRNKIAELFGDLLNNFISY